MPSVSTKVDLCQGHDACTPRPFNTFSPSVLVEGFEVARETDVFQDHGCPDHVPHSAVVTQGYPSITANGLRIAYVGAPVSCPSSVVGTGRPSVLAGEGSRISWSR
ncbi:PAAR domain-containing protein [Polyangium spumosum]|uniref:PaaR repeat-containing protein n=1 Tax=Polyangium spumosum TaxID=889282 RepID=A0A6N7Q1Z0_9BACT|nr:PAAR domain-containing protein [Polyangium spumosum]MRG98049.1 PaaR repeat-containing protein [Polyangium spumosum]